jgi:hypothetical protein
VQVRLLADKTTWRRDEPVVVWIVALNDSHEDVSFDRRLLVGPTPVLEQAGAHALPVSVEPSAARDEDNVVLLQPFCLYGREREFSGLPTGGVAFHGYLLHESTPVLQPAGPRDPEVPHTAAEPLRMTVHA